jgi:hypothetical protein
VGTFLRLPRGTDVRRKTCELSTIFFVGWNVVVSLEGAGPQGCPKRIVEFLGLGQTHRAKIFCECKGTCTRVIGAVNTKNVLLTRDLSNIYTDSATLSFSTLHLLPTEHSCLPANSLASKIYSTDPISRWLQ